MSLYDYYTSYYKNEEVSPLQCTDVLPGLNCGTCAGSWSSFLEDTQQNFLSFAESTPELVFSDTEDGDSSCGEESQSDSTHRRRRERMRSKKSVWEGHYVQFGPVHVREYLRCLGDHPVCFDNYPLCIGWAHGEETVYDINDYEDRKIRRRRRNSRHRNGKREGMARRLDTHTRKELLKKVFTIEEGDMGVECRLEMEPELVEDRWGANDDVVDSPLEDTNVLQQRDDNIPQYFGFPMMKVQVLED